MTQFRKILIFFGLIALLAGETADAGVLEEFKKNPDWQTATSASLVGNKLQLSGEGSPDGKVLAAHAGAAPLEHDSWYGDVLVSFDYLAPAESKAWLVVNRRYDVALPHSNNEWQRIQVKYRTVRYDEAGNQTEPPMVVEVRVNGEVTDKNVVYREYGAHALTDWNNPTDGQAILVEEGSLAIRNVSVQRADFSAITPPAESGGETNEAELIDYVALGRQTFESVGCNVCHESRGESSHVTTGPNLYGLFQREPRDREIVSGGENHRFQVRADQDYLFNSIRTPNHQLATDESGQAYPAAMPPISPEILTDQEIDAIGAWLATLNGPYQQGPVIKLLPPQGVAVYDPLTDDTQLLVDGRTRIQRGPLVGTSGRAIHVGQANGINYSFDPRLLAITKIWQGGYLDMGGEFKNRGGGGLKLGYKSLEIELGETSSLIAPLNRDGQPVDSTFQNVVFGDKDRILEELHSAEDHTDKLARLDARFKGYKLDSSRVDASPVFHYRVGRNMISAETRMEAGGEITVTIKAYLPDPQAFQVNTGLLNEVKTTTGSLDNGTWTLPAGEVTAQLTASMPLASETWLPPASEFNFDRQALRVKPSEANLPAGYRIESWYAPKDHYGRDQLFEALGLALAADGTLVAATRTAGIWHLKGGHWSRFAEGTFDSLGVQIEDDRGLRLVVGQKAELTRIMDINDDGKADRYETLFDAFSYHGNYHSYMHGPTRGLDGAYYLSINLADGNDGAAYNAGGPYMGSGGGYAGWHFRVEPDGSHQPWARGLRSPAGLGTAPDGQIWYSDNQGEYMGSSKIFIIEKDGFYGHPSSLVDLPGMTPDSPEIAWDQVQDDRVLPAIVLPHSRLANSPGNPAWDTTGGQFGPFAGQMLMGDQTQSNLFRVATEVVNGQVQGSIMPFIDGLESGVMRPLFLPDGSLLLGQTGRGWQARGGHVAALQRVVWDGQTVAPAIHSVRVTSSGFEVQLTRALAAEVTGDRLLEAVKLESWVYRDAPDYGSEEMGHHAEPVSQVRFSDDRKRVFLDLESLEHPSVHPQQTARLYHLELKSEKLFNGAAPETLAAYYSLYSFAAPSPRKKN